MFHKYLLKMSKKWKVRIMTLLQNQIGRNVWNLCTFSSLKYLFCFFLVYHQVSLSQINGQNTQNTYLYFEGLPKKGQTMQNFETKPTLVLCNLADILYCRQAKNRLNLLSPSLHFCDMQIKQHTTSKQVHWCYVYSVYSVTLWDVSKLARNNNLSI